MTRTAQTAVAHGPTRWRSPLPGSLLCVAIALSACGGRSSAPSPDVAPAAAAPTAAAPTAAAPLPPPAPVAQPSTKLSAPLPPRETTVTASAPKASDKRRHKSAAPDDARAAPPIALSVGDSAPPTLDKYSVVVSADQEIRIPGPPGELKVWIGNPEFKPAPDQGMHSGETLIAALSSTAKITPFAPGMEVKPATSACTRIDPSGSAVRFELIPPSKGSYKVGADVELYQSADCSGLPIPKTASTILVNVSVNTDALIDQHKNQLADATWNSFLGLWGNILALISGLVLFLLRKKLMQWFGFAPKA